MKGSTAVDQFLNCWVQVDYGDNISVNGRVDCLFKSCNDVTTSIVVRLFHQIHGFQESVMISVDAIKKIQLHEYLEEHFKQI
jgi:hypothetical protein